MIGLLHWLAVHTGSDHTAGNSVYYNFWSGFGSDLAEGTIPFGIALAWWHHTCANGRCPRPGRVPTQGGHKICRRCAGKPRHHLRLPIVHPSHLP